MNTRKDGGHMHGPKLENSLNWNTLISAAILVFGLGGGYAVFNAGQSANTTSITELVGATESLRRTDNLQNGRITTLEVNRANDSARLEDFKKDVLSRVDKLTEAVTNLSNSNAALSATIRQSERDARRRMTDP